MNLRFGAICHDVNLNLCMLNINFPGTPHTVCVLGTPHTVCVLGTPHTVCVLGTPHTVCVLGTPHTVCVLETQYTTSVLGTRKPFVSRCPCSHTSLVQPYIAVCGETITINYCQIRQVKEVHGVFAYVTFQELTTAGARKRPLNCVLLYGFCGNTGCAITHCRNRLVYEAHILSEVYYFN